MRVIVPILLVTVLAFFSCADDVQTDYQDAESSGVTASPSENALDGTQSRDESTVLTSNDAVGSNPTQQNASKSSSNAQREGKGQAARQYLTPAKVEHHPVPQPAMTTEVAEKIMDIDELVRYAEKERNKSLVRKDVTMTLFSEQDQFFYTSKENKVVEAMLNYKAGDNYFRHYFYFNDTGFAFYRLRDWYNGEVEPYSKELIVFFENNEIIDVRERKLILEPGEEGPNRLLNETFKRIPVDKKAIMEEIMSVWNPLLEEINDHEMGIK